MKKLLMLSVIVPSIFFIGCGSGGGSSDTPKKQSVEGALKLGDVIFNAPTDIDFNNKTRLTLKKQKKVYNKILKITNNNLEKETLACGISGTFDINVDAENTTSIFYNECVEYNPDTKLNEYYYGTITMKSDAEHFTLYNYSEIPDYNNDFGTGTYYKNINMYIHTANNVEVFQIDGTIEDYKNGVVAETMTYSNMLMKNNVLKKSWLYKGGFYDKVDGGCFTQNHVYDTDTNNWLVENSNNSNYWSSGTLYVDSIKYVYNKDDVAVTKGDITTNFKQQELIDGLKDEKSATNCNI